MKNTLREKPRFSLVGMVVGALALCGATLHFFMGPIEPPPPVEKRLLDKARKLKDAILAPTRSEQAPHPGPEAGSWGPDRLVRGGTLALGLCALLLAATAFVRREDLRACGMAAALGGGAVAFHFLVLALGAILLMVLVAVVVVAISDG